MDDSSASELIGSRSIYPSGQPGRGPKKLVKKIKAKVSRLGRFPNSGRIVPEYPASGLREIIVDDYRIIYRFLPHKSTVQIITVRHVARPLDA